MPPVVADRSEAGHCFHLLFSFGPGGLRAPPVVADRSEAGHCFHLLFFFFFFFLFLRILLFTHFGETPVAEILFPPIFWHNKKEYINSLECLFDLVKEKKSK